MKKFLVIVAAFLVAGGAYATFSGSSTSQPAQKEELQKPWMEVLSARVSLWDSAKNVEIRELKTGDEVDAGATLHVDSNGLANLYFPNGSVMRLDKDTTLTLDAASYDASKDSIVVKASLSLGRVWSKVVSLVTPDSQWEVQTANTVVTVRGTAFGVQVSKNGKSTVVGSEGKVAAKKKDQKEEVLVVADTFLSVEKGATTTEKLVLKAYTEEVSHDAWVIENKTGDRVFEAKVEAIREKARNETEVRTQFREQLQGEFRDRIEQRREELRSETPVPEKISEVPTISEEKSIETRAEVNTIIKTETTIKAPVQVEATVKTVPEISTVPVVVGLQIKTLAKEILTEGEAMPVTAVIAFREGPSKDLGTGGTWRVVGPIGSVNQAGVFTAKLADEVTENGTAKGFVVVTWKDPETGEEFLGKTPPITVNAAVVTSDERPI